MLSRPEVSTSPTENEPMRATTLHMSLAALAALGALALGCAAPTGPTLQWDDAARGVDQTPAPKAGPQKIVVFTVEAKGGG